MLEFQKAKSQTPLSLRRSPHGHVIASEAKQSSGGLRAGSATWQSSERDTAECEMQNNGQQLAVGGSRTAVIGLLSAVFTVVE